MPTLKTGAFTPVIPPYYIGQKLHSLTVGNDALSIIDPQTCDLPDAFFSKILNLFWQVKTFDVTVEWTFNDPPEINDAQVSYFPSKTGTQTEADVPLINPILQPNPEDPEGDQIPTNPYRDLPTGLVFGNVKFVETPYLEDRDAARQAVRETYDIFTHSSDFTLKTTSASAYLAERGALEGNFNIYFFDWTQRVQQKLNQFQGKTDDRSLIWIADLQRQLQVIPDIKERFLQDHITPWITSLDYSYYVVNQSNDEGFAIATLAKSYDLIMKMAVLREEDLEMFELSGGFKAGLDFLQAHYLKRFGVDCLPVRRGFDSKPSRFPCGFYFDTVAQKYKSTAVILPFIDVPGYTNFGWKSEVQEEYTASSKICESVGTVNRIATKSISFYPLYNGLTGVQSTCLGLDVTRVRNADESVIGTGTVYGGQFANCPLEPGGVSEIYTISMNYEAAWNSKGESIDPGPAPDFNQYSPEANGYVYSGPYFSGNSYDQAGQYFADIANAVATIKQAGNAEVGMLRFKNQADDLIFEAPIFGNVAAWEKFDVTYKIKTLWQDTVPAP
jgi:hypothetical protein